MEVLLFLLLPVAAFSGWLTGRKSSNSSSTPKYFVELNYPLNQQQDQTVDTLVRMPSLDDETIETHLTLGSIFRSRGELNRAIRLHQGLLERPLLSSSYKSLACLELARDYIAAGLLDRAEAMLLELVVNRQQLKSSLQHLLDLYQQGKEWLAAVNVAVKLQKLTDIDLNITVAQYYCELVELALKTQELREAKYYLKYAIKANAKCPRAIILKAKIEQISGNYNKAVKLYKHIVTHHIDYLPLIMNDIMVCCKKSSQSASVSINTIYKATKYRCANCGFVASRLQWYCPSCKQWEVIKPI